MDAERSQFQQDIFDSRPTNSKLFFFLNLPGGPDFIMKNGATIKISTGEIQNEWPGDNRHFDDEQFIIEADQFRNSEAEDFPTFASFNRRYTSPSRSCTSRDRCTLIATFPGSALRSAA